jgi:hypothetical protein
VPFPFSLDADRLFITDQEWAALRQALRTEAEAWLDVLRAPREYSVMELKGIIASIAADSDPFRRAVVRLELHAIDDRKNADDRAGVERHGCECNGHTHRSQCQSSRHVKLRWICLNPERHSHGPSLTACPAPSRREEGTRAPNGSILET